MGCIISVDDRLSAAVRNGDVTAARRAIDGGADVNYKDYKIEPDPPGVSYKTPLITAIRFGHFQCVRLLLERGADINKHDNVRIRHALLRLRERHLPELNSRGSVVPDPWCTHAREETGTSPNTCLNMELFPNPRRATVHIESLENDSLVIATAQLRCFESPLHYAVFHGKTNIVRALLERGARLDAVAGGMRDKLQNLPLHCAANEGHVDIVRLLLQRGADKSAKNKVSSRWALRASLAAPRSRAFRKSALHPRVVLWRVRRALLCLRRLRFLCVVHSAFADRSALRRSRPSFGEEPRRRGARTRDASPPRARAI